MQIDFDLYSYCECHPLSRKLAIKVSITFYMSNFQICNAMYEYNYHLLRLTKTSMMPWLAYLYMKGAKWCSSHTDVQGASWFSFSTQISL